MANIKSAIKRIRSSKRRAVRNKIVRTYARTAVKTAREAIESGTEVKDTTAAINAAASALDKAASKGILHKRNAARRKSRLMKAAAKIAKA
ncbi:MAG TPA: 30S ribosomal protein S20 [Anaerolineae bacterium]|nr:30S ribosomal protein S20 [Anaerolineae bacterium]